MNTIYTHHTVMFYSKRETYLKGGSRSSGPGPTRFPYTHGHSHHSPVRRLDWRSWSGGGNRPRDSSKVDKGNSQRRRLSNPNDEVETVTMEVGVMKITTVGGLLSESKRQRY